MQRDPYLGKQNGRTDGRDEKSLLELPGFYQAAKKTKDWVLVQNTALAIDVNGVEVRLGWET